MVVSLLGCLDRDDYFSLFSSLARIHDSRGFRHCYPELETVALRYIAVLLRRYITGHNPLRQQVLSASTKHLARRVAGLTPKYPFFIGYKCCETIQLKFLVPLFWKGGLSGRILEQPALEQP
jgi:hypothetical protein